MMSNHKTLINHTILYAIANFGSASLNFIILPFYTRYFHPEQFGLWDLALTTITLLTPFVTLELMSAIYRWLIEEDKFEKQKTIISTGLAQILKQLVIVNFVAVIVFVIISFPYQWLALCFLNVNVLSIFLLQCSRALKRNVLFATLSLLQTIIVIGTNLFLLLVFKLGIESFFYTNILAGITIIVIAWIGLGFNKFIKFKNAVSHTLLKKFLAYSIPIIPAAASWWIMTMSDRWIIAIFLGAYENGIYAIALKIPAVLLMINTVFSLAWKDSAILTFSNDEKNEFYTLIFKKYFRLLSIAVIVLILLAKPAISYFIGDAYFEAWKYTGILLIAALFHSLALFWSAGFHGAKQTKAILRSSIWGAVVNLLVNLILVKFIELYAIAISSFIAFFVTWIIRVREARGYFTIKLNVFEIFLLMVLVIGSCFVPFKI